MLPLTRGHCMLEVAIVRRSNHVMVWQVTGATVPLMLFFYGGFPRIMPTLR